MSTDHDKEPFSFSDEFSKPENEINVHELSVQLTELQKANREILEGRRAALNLMEDAIAAKEALYESEARNQAIISQSNVGIFGTNLSGTITFLNNKARQLFGFEASEGLGINVLDLTAPEFREQTLQKFNGVIEQGIPFESEKKIVRKDGTKFWANVSVSGIKGGSAETQSIVAIIVDITLRKAAEDALRESEAQLKIFNESLEKIVRERTSELTKQQILLKDAEKIGQMGSWEWNPDTKEIFWSDELYRLHGQEPQSFKFTVEWYLSQFVHPKYKTKVKKYLQSIFEENLVEQLEYLIITPLGEKMVLSKPQIIRGDEKLIRGIIQDITLQKKAQKQLVKLKLKQQRKILNTILNTQETERERIGEGLHNGIGQLLYAAKIKQEMVKGIDETSVNLLSEANKILDEAIADVRSLSFQLVPSVLKDFGLEVAITSMIQRLVTTNLKINFEEEGLYERLPQKVEIGLYRIIQELINNAIKHADASKIQIKLKLSAKSLILEVQDNGRGFDTKKVRELRKGIGLQSVQSRAKLLNASLQISSAKGKGTYVKVEVNNL